MIFKFCYKYKNKKIKPFCENLNNSKFLDIISYYLWETIDLFLMENNFYKKDLEELESKKKYTGIGSNSWEGIILVNKVYFYFTYYPDYRVKQLEISRKSLIELMKRWNEFLKREPDLDYEEVIELPDEENPTVYSEAFFGTFETFLEKYKGAGNYKNDLLFTAFFNTDMGEKCKIINFLINQGFSIDEFKDENLFIFLFDGVIRGKEDVEDLLEISKLLLGKKVDISRIEKHTQKTIFSNLLKILPKNEKILIPLYDLIFSQSHLKLLHKDVNGLTPLELAKKRKRNIALKYMEDYVEKYDLKDNDIMN